MFVVTAMQGATGWRLARHWTHDSTEVDAATEYTAMARGRRLVRELLCQGLETPGQWLIEFTKAMLGPGELAIGQAEELARQCASGESTSHRLLDRSGRVSLRSVAHALDRRGLKVEGNPRGNLWVIATFLVACCIAYVTLAFTLIRSTVERNKGSVRGKALVAVHGEQSNRTRHVLHAFSPVLAQTTVIVLGRPKLPLSVLQRQWSKETGASIANLLRPFSLRDGVAAIPESFLALRDGATMAARMPWLPDLRGQVGIIYRELLGRASARWWLRNGVRDACIVYGHTGLADTTALELAQQSVGCRTIHAVHGVSDGTNFVGRSSVAVFRCGHDAQWHSRLGGYGKCMFFPGVMPAFSAGSQGVLTLSNYIHPMNLWFQLGGERDEMQLLDVVARALDAVPAIARYYSWRPHPVFAAQPESLRDRVVSHAVQSGFTPWVDGGEIAAARSFSMVLCTPSSVVLDVLAMGAAPILLDLQQVDDEAAVACLPLIARNQQELEGALKKAAIESVRQSVYRDAWAAIMPAAPIDLNSLLRD